jgi:DNA-binding IclR family transcriptional regulator
MDDKNAAGGRRIQAVEISCELLTALERLGGAGVSELAAELGRSKATVHSHLATLLDQEFVVKQGTEYALSLRFVELGEHAISGVDIHDIAGEEVRRVADETGEVAQFMIEEHGKGVYLHKARGANAIQTSSYVGSRMQLHCTALGKAILSQVPRERVEKIIADTGLPRRTDNTITDPETLFAELEAVRKGNVAFDEEEVVKGLRCVAAPVTAGDRAAAISVSGPTSRFKGDRFHETLPELIRDAANVIEVNAVQV